MYKEGFEFGIETAKGMNEKEIMDLIKSIDEEETSLNGNSDFNNGFIDGLLKEI